MIPTRQGPTQACLNDADAETLAVYLRKVYALGHDQEAKTLRPVAAQLLVSLLPVFLSPVTRAVKPVSLQPRG